MAAPMTASAAVGPFSAFTNMDAEVVEGTCTATLSHMYPAEVG